jgi:uncharacterized protein YjiS (DUF1127 family)
VTGLVAFAVSASREPGRREGWRRAIDAIVLWHRRNRERRELMRLSERELRDFGIGRSDAIVEAGKPFWRP